MASSVAQPWQPQPVLEGFESLGSPDGPGSASGLVPDGAEPQPLQPRTRRLTLADVSRWARAQVSRIARETHSDRAGDLLAYAQAAKLVEEVGELHAELLGRSKRQRTDKIREFTDDTLAAELADVVLATALLAEIVGVDLSTAVTGKIAVINARSTGLGARTPTRRDLD